MAPPFLEAPTAGLTKKSFGGWTHKHPFPSPFLSFLSFLSKPLPAKETLQRFTSLFFALEKSNRSSSSQQAKKEQTSGRTVHTQTSTKALSSNLCPVVAPFRGSKPLSLVIQYQPAQRQYGARSSLDDDHPALQFGTQLFGGHVAHHFQILCLYHH